MNRPCRKCYSNPCKCEKENKKIKNILIGFVLIATLLIGVYFFINNSISIDEEDDAPEIYSINDTVQNEASTNETLDIDTDNQDENSDEELDLNIQLEDVTSPDETVIEDTVIYEGLPEDWTEDLLFGLWETITEGYFGGLFSYEFFDNGDVTHVNPVLPQPNYRRWSIDENNNLLIKSRMVDPIIPVLRAYRIDWIDNNTMRLTQISEQGGFEPVRIYNRIE